MTAASTARKPSAVNSKQLILKKQGIEQVSIGLVMLRVGILPTEQVRWKRGKDALWTPASENESMIEAYKYAVDKYLYVLAHSNI